MCVDLTEVFNRFNDISKKLELINNVISTNKGTITILLDNTTIKGRVKEIKSSSKFEMGEISATISLYDDHFNVSTYNIRDIENAF